MLVQVTRDRALRNWVFDETAQNMHMNTGSGYPGGNVFIIVSDLLSMYIVIKTVLLKTFN